MWRLHWIRQPPSLEALKFQTDSPLRLAFLVILIIVICITFVVTIMIEMILS